MTQQHDGPSLLPCERGWLIEGTHLSDVVGIHWWSAEHDFVTDAGRALRFARKQDAEAFQRTYHIKGTATEHEWSATHPTQPQAEGLVEEFRALCCSTPTIEQMGQWLSTRVDRLWVALCSPEPSKEKGD